MIVAADFAFARNASAIASATREGDAVRLVACREWIPGRTPLVPSVVFREAVGFALAHGADAIHADVHYREALREHASAAGLAVVSPPSVATVALDVRRLLVERRVRGLTDVRMRDQLAEIVAREGARGLVTVELPRWADGTHGDLAVAGMTALALAAAERAYASPASGRLARSTADAPADDGYPY